MKNAITKLDNTELAGRKVRLVEDKPNSRRRRWDHFYLVLRFLTITMIIVVYQCAEAVEVYFSREEFESCSGRFALANSFALLFISVQFE